VLVHYVEKGGADAMLLIGRKHKYLRNGDCCFGHFEVLFECGRVGYQLVVQVHQEVVPILIHWDKRSPLDIKLEERLQVPVHVLEGASERVDLVDLKALGLHVKLLLLVQLHSALGSLWPEQRAEEAHRL